MCISSCIFFLRLFFSLLSYLFLCMFSARQHSGKLIYLLRAQVGSEDRQLLFLYERGKKKLMDGAQVIFRGE